MLEKNTVVIEAKEYEELLKCKILVKSIFDGAFASDYGSRSVYFPADTEIATALFPKEMKNAKERALHKKESEGME